jgi:hypothetical protein
VNGSLGVDWFGDGVSNSLDRGRIDRLFLLSPRSRLLVGVDRKPHVLHGAKCCCRIRGRAVWRPGMSASKQTFIVSAVLRKRLAIAWQICCEVPNCVVTVSPEVANSWNRSNSGASNASPILLRSLPGQISGASRS